MYAILAAIVQLLIFFCWVEQKNTRRRKKEKAFSFLTLGFNKKLQKAKLISKQAEYRIERRAIWLSSLG